MSRKAVVKSLQQAPDECATHDGLPTRSRHTESTAVGRRRRQETETPSVEAGGGEGRMCKCLFFSTLAKGAQDRTFRFMFSLGLFLAVHAVACAIL